MSIEFTGIGNLGQIGSIKKGEKAQTDQKTDSAMGTDQVQFSSVLQDVHNAQSTESSSRSDRIDELKSQIADGSYQPDLNKVASNLLQFLMEEK